jgi:ATP-dependent 26S proteasome regulatory subunit
MSPADIKSLCQEAALAAMARDGATPSVTHEDFLEALSRIGEPEAGVGETSREPVRI